MKKTIIIFILVILFIIAGFVLFNNVNNKTVNTNNETIGKNIINEIQNSSIPNNTINIDTSSKEIELSTFSTNLQGDGARLNNIKLTCNTLNNTIVEPGGVF